MYCTIHYINENEAADVELSDCVKDSEVDEVRLFVSQSLNKAKDTCIRQGFFYSYVDLFFDAKSESFKCLVYNCKPATIGKVYVNNVGDNGSVMDSELEDFLDLTMTGVAATEQNIKYLLEKLMQFLESKHIAVEYISHYFVLNNSKQQTVELVILVKVIKKVSNNFVMKIHGWGIYDELLSKYYKYRYSVTRQNIYNFLNDITAFFPYIPYSVDVHTYVSAFKKENHFVLDFVTKCKLLQFSYLYEYRPLVRAASITSKCAECINYEMFRVYRLFTQYFNMLVLKGDLSYFGNSGLFGGKLSRNMLIKLSYPVSVNWLVSAGAFSSSHSSMYDLPFAKLLKLFTYVNASVNVLQSGSAILTLVLGGFVSSYYGNVDTFTSMTKQAYFDFMAHVSMKHNGILLGYSHNCKYDDSCHVIPLDEYVSGNDQYFISYTSKFHIQFCIESYIHAFRSNYEDKNGIVNRVNITSLLFKFSKLQASVSVANNSSHSNSYNENFVCKFGLSALKVGKYISLESNIAIMSGAASTVGLEGVFAICY